MFIEVVQKERICAGTAKKNMKKALMEVLQKKIVGKQMDKGGALLFPLSIDSITDAQIHEGLVYPILEYTAVAYKLYAGEILTCKVERQDAQGILLSNPLVAQILVPAVQIPQPSFLSTRTGRSGTYAEMWVWKYNEVSLYVRTGEKCRVRIVSARKGEPIYATIADSGLGPLSWW